MRSPGELPPDLRGGAFDVSTALSRGVGAERLRRRDLRRPFHGVRAPNAPVVVVSDADVTDAQKWTRRVAAIETRAREYAARMPDDQFFSHGTAAILHGLPVPAYLVDRSAVDVATTVREHRRAGRGVIGHFIPVDRVTVTDVGGLRVASAVDAWCQLSTVVSVEGLVIVGDSLVRRQQPFATMGQLESATADHVGRAGVRRLRAALESIRPRTDSPRETTLRLIIVRAGLPEPEVNVQMFNQFGAFMAFGDLVYVRYKILIEYDGGEHREDEKQFHRDIDRLDEPMEEGWRVIRVNNSHLGHRQHALIARIRRALLDRGWTPPVRSGRSAP